MTITRYHEQYRSAGTRSERHRQQTPAHLQLAPFLCGEAVLPGEVSRLFDGAALVVLVVGRSVKSISSSVVKGKRTNKTNCSTAV